MIRSLLLLVMLLTSMMTMGTSTSAQEGTPVALPTTPSPRLCTGRLDPDELMQRIESGAVVIESGLSEEVGSFTETDAFILPEGEPADEATVAAITATVREWVACVNSGQYFKLLALFSDEFLYLEYSDPPLTEDEIAQLSATPLIVPRQLYGSLVAVRDVHVLPDGRAWALVETDYPGAPPEGVEVDFLVFVHRDGRWFIDDLVEDLENEYPPVSGTPTP
jgi:hypothetical protein